MFNQFADFVTNMMAGGAMEIVLLIVLIVIALILLLVALWILWKLLALLGKGLLWLIEFFGGLYQTSSAARKEARRSRPPPVSTGWGRSRRVSLRAALAQARRLTSADTLCIVVVAGEGGSGDLCRSLDLTPPSVASIGIAAGGDTLLIDATRASRRELRRLARTLPWRRPVDGVAVLASADGLPHDGIARAADFARAVGMHVALHMVLPSRSVAPAWRIIDAANRDGDAICNQLAADTVRLWLVGVEREGLEELALAQARELPGSISSALSMAPSSLLDVASLGFSGVGLRGAVAQTVGRTRPITAPSAVTGLTYGTLTVGIALVTATALFTLDRTDTLRGTVAIAGREAAVPWTAEEIAAVPNSTRVRRVSGVVESLADLSSFHPLSPLEFLTPQQRAPRRLGAELLDSYILRPMAAALERQAMANLAPSENAESWLDDAQVITDWIAAWEALGDDPREVDVRALLAAAFGGSREDWPDSLDTSLMASGVDLPLPGEGGFDVGAITELARNNFNLTMQRWADAVYTNGQVATAARRAGDLTLDWRARRAALVDLRAAIQDPAQQWLTAAEDRSDHAAELRLLGRALALGLIDPLTTVEAKAAVARIRIDARNMVGQFHLPGLGPLLTRSSQNSGSNLQLSTDAATWFRFLDNVANAAGFANPPPPSNPPVRGVVTVDVADIARIRENLRAFDRFSTDMLVGLPAAPVRMLLTELASELVLSVAVEAENALLSDSDFGIASARAERRAAAALALEDLVEIETWLIGQNALSQAARVNSVRARIADGVLAAAAEALEQENPLGVHIDPTADSNAIVRRFERGLMRLQDIQEELVQPFLAVAVASGDGSLNLEWRDIADDLDAYARGDTDSFVSSLEGTVRAWAEDPAAACVAPRALTTGRNDYLARVVETFRAEVDSACEAARVVELERLLRETTEFYDIHIRGYWPFAPSAPEVGAAALSQFVERLHTGADAFPEFEGQLAANFAEHASFWSPADIASVRFKALWRRRSDIESFANHVADVRIEGTEVEEGTDVHVWRYGEPFSVHLRLATNSSWQFRLEDGRLSREWSIEPGGLGALLRAFEGLVGGELVYEAELLNAESGEVATLRISARIVHDDDRPMEVPAIGAGAV